MNKKKISKIFSLSLIIMLISVCTLNTKASTFDSNELNNESILIDDDSSNQFYISGNELIKVVIEEDNSQIGKKSVAYNEDGTVTKEMSPLIKLYTKELDEQEKADLLNIETRSGALSKSDQAMNPAGNFRTTLTVTYANSAGGISGLHLCKATGSYQRLTGDGVTVNSAQLHYNATGAIYSNGSFVRNGSVGFTQSSGGTFSNVQLMSEGTCVVNVSTAGVSYTLYCSRGITIPIYMRFY